MLSVLRFSNKPIVHNFFASYHGHSLADSHAAAVKKVLHSEYNHSQVQRFSPNLMAIYWGPTNAGDVSNLITRACANTQVHVFPHIHRDPELKPKVRRIERIKAHHCFVYTGAYCFKSILSAGTKFEQFTFLHISTKSLQNT